MKTVALNKELLKEHLTKLQEIKQGFLAREMEASLEILFGTSWFEGNFHDKLVKMEKLLIETIGQATGTYVEDIEWFVYECQFGEIPLMCWRSDGQKVKVIDVDTFIETLI